MYHRNQSNIQNILNIIIYNSWDTNTWISVFVWLKTYICCDAITKQQQPVLIYIVSHIMLIELIYFNCLLSFFIFLKCKFLVYTFLQLQSCQPVSLFLEFIYSIDFKRVPQNNFNFQNIIICLKLYMLWYKYKHQQHVHHILNICKCFTDTTVK